jgi:sarcosine oxidase subunit alpha
MTVTRRPSCRRHNRLFTSATTAEAAATVAAGADHKVVYRHMAGRLYPPRDPVTFTVDGERVVADRGEPVAAAMLAAGIVTMARSPKFHRPRGPACMRGACDGCLARVDGEPNVMTCMTAAAPGMEVVSQNTLGARELDLLRVTDWFFPDGMNHHELFAGIPGVQEAMQLFARRVAGLGRLPDVGPPRDPVASAARRQLPLLVVGAGPAGMAVAVAAARKGVAVEVVDDALAPGGGARGLTAADDAGIAALRASFDGAVASGAVSLRCRTVAAGVFGRDVLVMGLGHGDEPARVEVLEPAALVLASGAHDGVVLFENNDFPGVMSARAACLAAVSGAAVGREVVVLVPPEGRAREPGELSFADVFEATVARHAAAGAPLTRVTRVSDVVRVKGSTHLRAVVVRESERERTLAADVLLVDARRAPAYELCEQAGATIRHCAEGFVPVTDRGRVADGVWAVGEVTGAPLSVARFVDAAAEIVAQL